MEFDFDVGAVVVSVGSALFCAGIMYSTVQYLKKAVEAIEKDFKGIGAKLGRQDLEMAYLKGKMDAVMMMRGGSSDGHKAHSN